MQVVEVLSVDEQVEHVVALTRQLQADFNPVQLRRLEKLGRLELTEEISLRKGKKKLLLLLLLHSHIPLGHALWRTMVELIEDIVLEELLVRDTDLDRLTWWAVLEEPVFDQWNILGTACVARAFVEGVRGPVEGDAVGSVVRVQLAGLEEGGTLFGKLKVVVQLVDELVRGLFSHQSSQSHLPSWQTYRVQLLVTLTEGDRVDEGVEIVRRQVRVLGLDVRHGGVVVPRQVDRAGSVVVQVRESHAVLGANRATDDNLVDIVELVPILLGRYAKCFYQVQLEKKILFISKHTINVAEQRLKLGTARDGHVQRLGSEERRIVKPVENFFFSQKISFFFFFCVLTYR